MLHNKIMATSQQFCLRWNNHQSTLISVFDHLLESGTLVDCTLAAEGQFLKAHKVVLSACSPYLEALLSQHYEKHPILILKDVTFQELKSMLDYMYRGEVNISQEQLGTFLKAAESLQIKGLTESGAIHENKDLERAREMEHLRELQSIGLDRSLGIPILPKRMEVRKHIPIVPRARSPLVGLPSNYIMNSDQRKNNKSDANAASPVNSRNREGSTSPTVKRKRMQNTNSAQTDENKTNHLSKLLENNHVENHLEKRKEQVSQNSSDSVPTNNLTAVEKKVNNHSVIDSENSACAVPVKCEVKTECADFTDEVQNDDSVGDMTVDEEEEEMDEMDLSRPGPSSSANSTVAGIPWHMAGEGNGEEMLLAQSDAQDASRNAALLECFRCHKTYSSPHTLRRHVRLECGQEPKFFCPYCPHRTKQRYNLMLHIGRTHRELLEATGVQLNKTL